MIYSRAPPELVGGEASKAQLVNLGSLDPILSGEIEDILE